MARMLQRAPGVAPGAVQPLAEGAARQELAHQPAVLRRLQHGACAQGSRRFAICSFTIYLALVARRTVKPSDHVKPVYSPQSLAQHEKLANLMTVPSVLAAQNRNNTGTRANTSHIIELRVQQSSAYRRRA